MPIEPSAPVVATITETVTREAVFPSMWIKRLEVEGGPESPVTIAATFVPWDPVTNKALDRAGDERVLEIPDLFAAAAADMQLASAVNRLIAELERQAKAKGVI